jgi:PAS domain-containing protein
MLSFLLTPAIRARPAQVARLASALALLVGLDVVIGRCIGIEPLLRAVPGAAAMALLTALGFITAAVSLWHAAQGPSAPRIGPVPAWQAGGLAVALIGAIRIGAYACGWNSALDSLGLHAAITATLDGHTAQMSPATAGNFVLLGFALAVSHTRRGGIALQAAAWASSLLGWLGLSHFIFGGASLPAFTHMSLPTAALFIVLSGGALSIRPELGFIALLLGDGPGGRMSRRLIPIICTVPLVGGWLCVEGLRAGWFGTEAAIALFAFGNVVVFGAVIWRTAGRLNQLDSERSAAQRALATELQLLDFALNVNHMGAWDLDLRTHVVHRTLTHARIFGYAAPLPAWSYERFLGHVLPEDQAEVDRQFRAAIRSQSDYRVECRIRRADGEVRTIVASGSHVREPDGTARRVRGVVQDVTDPQQRRRGHRGLQDHARHHRAQAPRGPAPAQQQRAHAGQSRTG